MRDLTQKTMLAPIRCLSATRRLSRCGMLATMDGPQDREYSAWKDIANRLQVSVRTAQEWEKLRGLPVRRVPGRNGRVFLREADLDDWLKRPEAAATSDSPPSTFQRHRVALFSISAVAVAAIWFFAVPESQGALKPSSWHVNADTLIVSDAAGRELWRVRFAEELSRYYDSTSYDPAMAHYAPKFVDITGDGSVEVLFPYSPEDSTVPGALVAFSESGEELWRFIPGSEMRTAQRTFSGRHNLSAFTVVRRRSGRTSVVLASHHHLYFPSQVSLLSSEGVLEADYWHAGHLGGNDAALLATDRDGDEADEIYLGGLNNARAQATLVVLDPDTMGGAGGEESPKYQFLDKSVGRETARVFIPPSSLCTSSGNRYNVVTSLVEDGDTLIIGTLESLGTATKPMLQYEFGPGFQLVRIEASDNFIQAYSLLVFPAAVAEALETEQARLAQRVEVQLRGQDSGG